MSEVIIESQLKQGTIQENTSTNLEQSLRHPLAPGSELPVLVSKKIIAPTRPKVSPSRIPASRTCTETHLNKTMETHGPLVSNIAVGFTMVSPVVCLVAAYLWTWIVG